MTYFKGYRGTLLANSTLDKSEIAPTLCLAFENGLIQLSRGDDDSSAIVVNTDLNITFAAWNNSGSTLAVTGSYNASNMKNMDDEKGTENSKV
jgi:hypothetical protein